jgi:hypothetical protein
MAAGLLVMFANLLNIIAIFEFVCIVVRTVYRMLTGDVLRFIIVYVVMLYGFGLAMYVLIHEGYSEQVPGLTHSANQVSVVHITIHGLLT